MNDGDAIRDFKRRLAEVERAPGFLDFSRELGARIAGAHMADALTMLQFVGAPAALAWRIVDGWEQPQRIPGMLDQGLEAALRFACFVDSLDRYDWPALLEEALREVGGAPSSHPAPRPSP